MNDPRLESMGDTSGSDVCGCGHSHINGQSGSCSKFACACREWHPPESEPPSTETALTTVRQALQAWCDGFPHEVEDKDREALAALDAITAELKRRDAAITVEERFANDYRRKLEAAEAELERVRTQLEREQRAADVESEELSRQLAQVRAERDMVTLPLKEEAKARLDRAVAALREIVRRDATSDYTSIYAAPGEFRQVAEDCLHEIEAP